MAVLPSALGSAPEQVALHELVERWRTDARTLKGWGALGHAQALERAATELEAVLTSAADEPLTLRAAARESGFSADHLGRLVRSGVLPNHGRLNAPRIRRGDLPRRPALRNDVKSSTIGAPRRRLARSVITAQEKKGA